MARVLSEPRRESLLLGRVGAGVQDLAEGWSSVALVCPAPTHLRKGPSSRLCLALRPNHAHPTGLLPFLFGSALIQNTVGLLSHPY